MTKFFIKTHEDLINCSTCYTVTIKTVNDKSAEKKEICRAVFLNEVDLKNYLDKVKKGYLL